jgi:hypothetical protein
VESDVTFFGDNQLKTISSHKAAQNLPNLSLLPRIKRSAVARNMRQSRRDSQTGVSEASLYVQRRESADCRTNRVLCHSAPRETRLAILPRDPTARCTLTQCAAEFIAQFPANHAVWISAAAALIASFKTSEMFGEMRLAKRLKC